MDLYGDLDLYTNIPAVPAVAKPENKNNTKETNKPVVEAKSAPPIKAKVTEPEPPKQEHPNMKSGLPTSALKFIPQIRRREGSASKPAKPTPISATAPPNELDVKTPKTRFSPAASNTLKTTLGMAAFTNVSVTRKSSKDSQANTTPTNDYDDDVERLKHHADNIREEYDPFRPNDYSAYCDLREMNRKNAEVKRDLEIRQRRQDEERKREREQLEKDLEAGRVPNLATSTVPGGRGRGMNLPAWMMKKIETKSENAVALPSPARSSSAPGQFDDGERRGGLGFSSGASSSSTPSTGLGFVQSSDGEVAAKKPRVSRFGQRVSRFDEKVKPLRNVLLLLNMVGPGDVDADLQHEVKEECETKYGPVKQCVIYEVKPVKVPEEAVRIFVEFQHEADASKALEGLNARYFGGRRLAVSVYDRSKFDKLELAP